MDYASRMNNMKETGDQAWKDWVTIEANDMSTTRILEVGGGCFVRTMTGVTIVGPWNHARGAEFSESLAWAPGLSIDDFRKQNPDAVIEEAKGGV